MVRPNVGLVDTLTFLLDESDCVGIKVSDLLLSESPKLLVYTCTIGQQEGGMSYAKAGSMAYPPIQLPQRKFHAASLTELDLPPSVRMHVG